MRYEQARNMVFDYFLMEKNLNSLNNDIERYKRNMPYDNAAASEYIMEQMDVVVDKRDELIEEMEKLKEEINLLLRVFK